MIFNAEGYDKKSDKLSSLTTALVKWPSWGNNTEDKTW